MRAIASDRQWRIDAAWIAFALMNLALMVTVPDAQTIPFHNVWVSLSLLYGFTFWRPRTAVLVGVIVTLMTGGAMLAAVEREHLSLDEMAEVPMMAAMFAVMVWHVHRRDTAEALVRTTAERERDFVRDASHQLRTPITVARGHAELIREQSADAQVVEDADIIVDELGRLERLSDGLLMLASAEHRDFLARRPLDVERFVRSTAERWSVAAPRQWRVDIGARGTVNADPHRLAHVMDALVENALKATEPGGLIEFASRASGGDLLIEVRDDGAGIAPADHARIFDRFARTAGAGGTGLGLPMVRAIATAHGGTVTVRSEPDTGATFVLSLPGLRPAPATAPNRIGVFQPTT